MQINGRGDYGNMGRYCEVLFKAECLKRGLLVLNPEVPSLAFDVAIYDKGKFYRIQVKGTMTVHQRKQGDGYGFEKYYKVLCFSGKKRKHYSESGVDFIAAYVIPLKTWFIVPIAMATGRTLELRPNPVGKMLQCRERWDLLGAQVEL